MKLPALKEIVEERKEKAIETLSDSFAKNKLPLEEYERLVEYIHKTESERELVLVEKMVAEFEESGLPEENASDGEDEPEHYPQQGFLQNSNISLLSTRVYSGHLKSGAQFVSFLGSGQIRVRREDLTKSRTNLQVVSILGDNVILVEPGINVVNNAIPILGNTEVNQKVHKQAKAGYPELVISGTALLGDISVKLLKE